MLQFPDLSDFNWVVIGRWQQQVQSAILSKQNVFPRSFEREIHCWLYLTMLRWLRQCSVVMRSWQDFAKTCQYQLWSADTNRKSWEWCHQSWSHDDRKYLHIDDLFIAVEMFLFKCSSPGAITFPRYWWGSGDQGGIHDLHPGDSLHLQEEQRWRSLWFSPSLCCDNQMKLKK